MTATTDDSNRLDCDRDDGHNDDDDDVIMCERNHTKKECTVRGCEMLTNANTPHVSHVNIYICM